jgi:hypothetical protein
MRARASRFPLLAAVLMTLVGAVGCGGEPDIRSVADFDDHPCALLPEDTMKSVVSPPYMDLAGVDVKPNGAATASSTGDDTFACTYTYAAAGSPAVREVAAMTVTIAHTRTGSQPFSICAAGATARAGGYRTEEIGDQACMSPTTDLWMRIGEHFYHVVVVPQPGFSNPVEASQALSVLILDVARAAAARMPKA